MFKPVAPKQWVLLFTSLPALVLVSVGYTIFSGNLFFLLIIPAIIFFSIITPPVSACHICGLPLEKRVKGLIEHHEQCDCVPHRWRPVWYTWFEDINVKLMNKWRRFK